MKVRKGFVSNSSSCSFIVNVKNGGPSDWDLDKYLVNFGENDFEIRIPIKDHTFQFNWEEKRYYDVVSKLNYAVIQAFHSRNEYLNRQTIEDALCSRIKEVKGETATLSVWWDYNAVMYDSGISWAEIDHQSMEWTDSSDPYYIPPVHDIFRSVDAMKNYLFNPNAYIQGGNDNGGDESKEYRESRDIIYGKWYGLHENRLHECWKKKGKKMEEPLLEGLCKECGSPVVYRTIHETEEGEVLEDWDRIIAYHNLKGKNEGSTGYYMCTNPDCQNHKRYYVEELNCNSVPFLIRNKESE